MRLRNDVHLAYCTNIHRGESWPQTLETLQRYTLAVRERVCPDQPYAIGLRLSDRASRELAAPETLAGFRKWLDQHRCYIFTINGFPFGQFHGGRVKELAYTPDWTTPERLVYTNRLFDLLAELLPEGVEGSVSTVPGSFKELIHSPDQVQAMRGHLWQCVEHMAHLSARTGQKFHLGLEPEPLCFLETSQETAAFFEQMQAEHPNDPRLAEHLRVNYDACHLAVEFEEPAAALSRLQQHGIRLSKLHFSNALKVRPTPETREALAGFVDSVYFHQVVAQTEDGELLRFRDLDVALDPATSQERNWREWRIHFHIPLHCQPNALFDNTADHLLGLMDLLAHQPALCSHIEMETYTWEVLPPNLKNRHVVDQLVSEYEWTLQHLAARGLRPL